MTEIKAPGPQRQLAFHQLLVAARKTVLLDALSEALADVDPATLKQQIIQCVPADVQQLLATSGVRDEQVFPTPIVLEVMPTLLGYYRLLLGISQKGFYRSEAGLSRFKSMETKGNLSKANCDELPALCKAMSEPLSELVRQLSPKMEPRDVRELPLITLGAQFQGGNNNTIGKLATDGVFLTISELVEKHVTKRTENRLILRNSAGRTVVITLSSDPDVGIQEEFAELRPKVAIEIKGGTDKSNAHNRAGEAEKSHLKAKDAGYREFWTIIAKKGIDMDRLSKDSPTTNFWLDIAQVLAQEGEDWDRFRSHLAEVTGIPLSK